MSTLAKLEMKENCQSILPRIHVCTRLSALRSRVNLVPDTASCPGSSLGRAIRVEVFAGGGGGRVRTAVRTAITGRRASLVSPAFPTRAENCISPALRTATVRPPVIYSRGVSAARGVSRVLADWCTDYNCKRLDDGRRRPRRPARLRPAASGGPTLPGVRACRGIPRGGPYLSTDGAETRHP